MPHSEISGSKLVDSSPKLIAVFRVLHSLLMPRHPSCARIRLARNFTSLSRYVVILFNFQLPIFKDQCPLQANGCIVYQKIFLTRKGVFSKKSLARLMSFSARQNMATPARTAAQDAHPAKARFCTDTPHSRNIPQAEKSALRRCLQPTITSSPLSRTKSTEL